MNPDAVLMSPDEVLATSVCKFAESFTRFTIDESAFSFNLSIAITSSSGLLLALLIKTLEIFHVQTRAFHTVRFTPCVSHRAFHKPVPPGSLTDTRKLFGDLIDTHAQVIYTWDHISPNVRANLACAVDLPCSRSSWRRLILAQAHPGTGPGRGSRDSSIFDMHDLVLYHAPTTDFTQTIDVLWEFKPRDDKKKNHHFAGLCGTPVPAKLKRHICGQTAKTQHLRNQG